MRIGEASKPGPGTSFDELEADLWEPRDDLIPTWLPDVRQEHDGAGAIKGMQHDAPIPATLAAARGLHGLKRGCLMNKAYTTASGQLAHIRFRP